MTVNIRTARSWQLVKPATKGSLDSPAEGAYSSKEANWCWSISYSVFLEQHLCRHLRKQAHIHRKGKAITWDDKSAQPSTHGAPAQLYDGWHAAPCTALRPSFRPTCLLGGLQVSLKALICCWLLIWSPSTQWEKPSLHRKYHPVYFTIKNKWN